MKSNEEYLDELLQSMNSDNTDDTALNRLYDASEKDLEETTDTLEESTEANTVNAEASTGKMDQSMIDALLSGISEPEETTDTPEESTEANAVNAEVSTGKMDQSMIDALLSGISEPEEITDISENSTEEPEEKVEEVEESAEENSEQPETDNLQDLEEQSMLAQLMAEMREESESDEEENGDGSNDFEIDDDIEALLTAAQEDTTVSENDDIYSFDADNVDDMAEIEALLNMSDNDEIADDNMELLRMLEAQESESIPLKEEKTEESGSGDSAEIQTAHQQDGLPKDTEVSEGQEGESEGKKKGGGFKRFFQKLFSALMEEIPEEDGDDLEKDIDISDENKKILEQLDQEEDKKIKVKEKKEKKEKPKKEKAKKEKPKKEKPKKEKVPEPPEKKLPRKKVIVTFVFAMSVLILILSIEFLAVPVISLNGARSAYDKGNYDEAYKEYYGHKLSEEDEVRFQAATVILRMQSNLDGYYNYMNMHNEVYALHSLLEAVHIKYDAFFKAEQFGVLSQVEAIYQDVLEILQQQYQLSEAQALEIIEEKSDTVYTRKLEALVEGTEYTSGGFSEMNQEDILPEEEVIFRN